MLLKLIVTVVGLLLIIWVNWYFLFSGRKKTASGLNSEIRKDSKDAADPEVEKSGKKNADINGHA